MNRRGIFIVLEGIEGCGKSTQARRLMDWLERRDVPHRLVREPGHTAEGEEIRRVLLHSAELPARAELLLMLAARAILVERIVRPALEAGEVVVADRYALSSMAYQGFGRGLPLEEVRGMNAFATGGLEPDLVLVLEVGAEESVARRTAAGRDPDRIERAGAGFHARVAEGYAALARTEPGVVRVDGTGDAEEVERRIHRLLQDRFPETLRPAAG